jgi:hypothetical protein
MEEQDETSSAAWLAAAAAGDEEKIEEEGNLDNDMMIASMTNHNDPSAERQRRLQQSHNRNLRPGAVSIRGMSERGISQHTFLYNEEQQPGNTSTAAPTSTGDNGGRIENKDITAEVLSEDQLFQEMLTQRQQDVVQAEAIAIRKKRLRRILVVARIFAVSLVVITAVLIPKLVPNFFIPPKHHTPLLNSTNATVLAPRPNSSVAIPPPPTARPVVTVNETHVLSILLHHNVSSIQDLTHSGAPPYQAYQWLANNEDLSKNSTAETVIDRYVLAVIYYADNGLYWKHGNQSYFLSNRSVCEWHDDSGSNGTGAVCNQRNVLQGNVHLMYICIYEWQWCVNHSRQKSNLLSFLFGFRHAAMGLVAITAISQS